jgi:polyhydroxybutyrate depolymerase
MSLSGGRDVPISNARLRRWLLPAAGAAALVATGAVVALTRDAGGEPGAQNPCAAPPPAAGAHTFSYGGRERSYLLALPADHSSPRPLLLSLHGFSSNKDKQEANTAMGANGTARGFIVVTPEALGVPKRWNIAADPGRPDDFGFLRALVDDLRGRLCVDPQRMYAAGISNGSAAAAQLVCQPPYGFAAVGLVSATVPAECPPDVAVSVIAIHGTADDQVPYTGGRVGDDGPSVPPAEKVIAWYATRYRCKEPPAVDEPAPGVRRRAYTGCAHGAEVVLDTVTGGGHHWPGGNAAVEDPKNSAAGKQFPATDTILDFFAAHPRR